MNGEQYIEALTSELPSERMRAAQWALENELSPEHERLLVDAVAREGVPRIRAALSSVLKRSTQQSPTPADDDPEGSHVFPAESQLFEILDDLSGMIGHEMQPAIGWVRFAANKEILDFDTSATNRAIEALRRRVDGLAALAAAHRIPANEVVSLAEVLSGCISMEYPASMFIIDQNDQAPDDIVTDRGLLSLVLTNAIQNAADAVRGLPIEEGQVMISMNVTKTTFWLTISNRFAGASFEYSNVAASGRTSKLGHRGLGTRIVDLATSRLGYAFDLQAAGGTATFSLRGNRFV